MNNEYIFLPDTPEFEVIVEGKQLTARVVAKIDLPIETAFRIHFSDNFEGDFISDENLPGGWAAKIHAGIPYAQVLEPALFNAMKDFKY